MDVNSELINAILENIGEGLIVTDNLAVVVMVNQKAEELFDIKLDQVLGKKLDDILHLYTADKKLVDSTNRAVNIALKYGHRVSEKYFCDLPGGKQFPLLVTAAPVSVKNQLVGAISVYRDITHERAIEKMKDDFVSLSAHQLRGPLAITRWSVELFSDEEMAALPLSAQEKIRDIYSSNKTMIALVNDLLDVSRIDQGKIPNDPVEFDSVSAVRDVVLEYQRHANQKDIQVNFETSEESVILLIDPKRFRQVVDNIISNAVKFNQPKGWVEVKLETVADYLQLTVADNGIGIPADEQEKVWEKFHRAANAVKAGIPGTGLGLYMVRSYVLGWGGKVWFESKQFQGTKFFLQLPLKKVSK